MGKGPLSAVWAAAAIFVWLCGCTYGQRISAASGPHIIAASGTTVVDLVIPSLLANATKQLAPAHGTLSLTYESVDSPTDVRNWITHADDFAVAYIALTSQLYQQANRPLLQIPWAVANTAVAYNLPGTPEDALRLNPQVLAGIYSCKITSWQDPAIVALNPSLSLPNIRIVPASYSESKGTTYVFTQYLSLDPSWTLGAGIQIPWPRCVQHVRTPDGILSAVAKTPGAIAWAVDWRINGTLPVQLFTASLQNAAGNFMPSNATYSVASLPVPAVTSANWINVTFATSKQADIYPMGNFIYNIIGQDVSSSGADQASAVKDLMAYFVSDAVQRNLPGWALMPLPKALATAAQQAVSAIVTTASNQTRGSSATISPAPPVGGGDSLVSGGTVLEGSGGASIQNLVKAVLANASASGRFGTAGLTFAPTDSDQGKQGVITQSFSYAMSTLPLTQDELNAAARPMVQVPVGYGPVAIIHSLPNVSNNVLQVNQQVLAAIFQCQITTWNDVALTALNPNITLPNQPIFPLGLSDPSGTTSLFATYLARSPGWKLGMGTSMAWPRCVRRTIGGSNAMVNGVNATSYTIGYAALGSVINAGMQRIAVATVLNKGGLYISPYNCPFPFHQDELPPSISSPAWNTLNFNATVVHPDRYAIGGLIYLMTSQNLSLLGYPQSVIMQQLALYWLSSDVQSNMSSMGASPLLPSYSQTVQQQLNMLNTEAAGPALAPGVSAAGNTSSGTSQSSSKAGFPWWAGLIIALVALALIVAVAGLACLSRARRRRRQDVGLEGAMQKQSQEPALASLGGGGADRHAGGHPGPPLHDVEADKLATLESPRQGSGDKAASHDSDAHIAMEEAHDGLQDDRMPLDTRGASVRSFHSSGGTTQRGGGSLQGSLNGQPRSGDRRRSSSYGRDTWPESASKGSWGTQSRGQSLSLNNEAAYHSLPDILKSRAENVDIEDIERGSLLGRGSFGKVYQGWWRGGTVAIKVVPHEGDLGEKVEIVRESLLSSSIQHPQIVTTYKAITVSHGAHHTMRREESIPEGATFPSSKGSGRGSGSSNTNKSSGPKEDLMETWIIMEYCDLGSLDSAIADGRFTDLEHLLLRLLDVAMGMDYLHKLGILHTDLKPSNVLLKTAPKQANDPTGCTCKLADFGLSRVMETNATHISTNTIGTIAYQPEEVLKEGKVTPASDVYSFAILMYELYTCKHLFKGMMHSQMFFKVFNGYRPPMPEGTPKGMKDLMEACWSHNPAERPSFRFITRALQRLIIEQRRARSSGRAASMNLDDALAGAEMAKQYPVAPSMPIQAPSDAQRSSSRESMQTSNGGSSSQQPQSGGQKAISLNEFEMALLEFRKKSLASEAAPSQPEQPAPQQPEVLQGSSNGNAARRSGERGVSEDGPKTPPKMHSSGSPPPEGALPNSAPGAPGSSAVSPQGSPASPHAAPGAARSPDAPVDSAGLLGGQPGTALGSAAAAEPCDPGRPAEGSGQGELVRPSAFAAAAQSTHPIGQPLDRSPTSPEHVPPLRPRISKANRYDMLLGD